MRRQGSSSDKSVDVRKERDDIETKNTLEFGQASETDQYDSGRLMETIVLFMEGNQHDDEQAERLEIITYYIQNDPSLVQGALSEEFIHRIVDSIRFWPDEALELLGHFTLTFESFAGDLLSHISETIADDMLTLNEEQTGSYVGLLANLMVDAPKSFTPQIWAVVSKLPVTTEHLMRLFYLLVENIHNVFVCNTILGYMADFLLQSDPLEHKNSKYCLMAFTFAAQSPLVDDMTHLVVQKNLTEVILRKLGNPKTAVYVTHLVRHLISFSDEVAIQMVAYGLGHTIRGMFEFDLPDDVAAEVFHIAVEFARKFPAVFPGDLFNGYDFGGKFATLSYKAKYAMVPFLTHVFVMYGTDVWRQVFDPSFLEILLEIVVDAEAPAKKEIYHFLGQLMMQLHEDKDYIQMMLEMMNEVDLHKQIVDDTDSEYTDLSELATEFLRVSTDLFRGHGLLEE